MGDVFSHLIVSWFARLVGKLQLQSSKTCLDVTEYP